MKIKTKEATIPFKELKLGEMFIIYNTDNADNANKIKYFMKINILDLVHSHNAVNIETGKTMSIEDDRLVVRVNGCFVINEE